MLDLANIPKETRADFSFTCFSSSVVSTKDTLLAADLGRFRCLGLGNGA